MAKIRKDRPLPRHTKLVYEECFAKLLLERLFPDRFQDLEISDRPDLRTKDGMVGIEVTSAISKEDQEARTLASEIPYLDEERRRKRICYLRCKGYEYSLISGMSSSGRISTYLAIIYAVENKIKKLNSGNYDLLHRYDLFVESEVIIQEWMIPVIIDKLCSLSEQPYYYTFIYVLALDGLYVFDIPSRTCSIIEEIQKKTMGLGEKARAMVEEGETDGIS